MTPTNTQIRIAIAQQAADWLVANRSGSPEEKGDVEFMNWLKTSPIHVEEYLQVAAIARDLRSAVDPQVSMESLLAAARSDRADRVATLGASPPRREWLTKPVWTRAVFAIPATALAAVVVGFVVFSTGGRELLSPTDSYETAHGEQSARVLSDGSSVRLNTDSTVKVRFTRAERLIEVTRGQAFFQVAHDARRRFRVTVGGADVVALGTQFDIYRRSQTTTVVSVVEGRIGVFSGQAPPTSRGAGSAIGGTTVSAGQQLRIESGIVSDQPTMADLHQVEAWLHDQIAFEQRRLGEITDEFNRYTSIPVEISEPLRGVLVSGIFNAYDTDSFIAFLRTLDGVVVERTPTRIFVRRRAPVKRDSAPQG